jgi:hypothetical protein
MRSKCFGAKDGFEGGAVKLPSARHSANFRSNFKLICPVQS